MKACITVLVMGSSAVLSHRPRCHLSAAQDATEGFLKEGDWPCPCQATRGLGLQERPRSSSNQMGLYLLPDSFHLVFFFLEHRALGVWGTERDVTVSNTVLMILS